MVAVVAEMVTVATAKVVMEVTAVAERIRKMVISQFSGWGSLQ